MKSEMTPHLKINFMVYRWTVENFMLLSQFAQFFNFTELNGYTIRHGLSEGHSLATYLLPIVLRTWWKNFFLHLNT